MFCDCDCFVCVGVCGVGLVLLLCVWCFGLMCVVVFGVVWCLFRVVWCVAFRCRCRFRFRCYAYMYVPFALSFVVFSFGWWRLRFRVCARCLFCVKFIFVFGLFVVEQIHTQKQ